MKFKVNKVSSGPDRLHIEHPYEECNTDQAGKMKSIDQKEALALLDKGEIQLCGHCNPDPYEDLPATQMKAVGEVVNPPEA